MKRKINKFARLKKEITKAYLLIYYFEVRILKLFYSVLRKQKKHIKIKYHYYAHPKIDL